MLKAESFSLASENESWRIDSNASTRTSINSTKNVNDALRANYEEVLEECEDIREKLTNSEYTIEGGGDA